jgi:acyl carrier protein
MRQKDRHSRNGPYAINAGLSCKHAGAGMTRTEVFERFLSLLRELADDDSITVTDTSTAEDVEAWDSVLHVKLILAIEAEFGIRFSTDEINAPEDVGQLIDLIHSKL